MAQQFSFKEVSQSLPYGEAQKHLRTSALRPTQDSETSSVVP
jgi:hypothetical protein